MEIEMKITINAAILIFFSSLSFPSLSETSYEIEKSYNEELFVINGERYKAKTYCFNMEEGDEVVFLYGSPYGACASAELLNLRTNERCEVWCE